VVVGKDREGGVVVGRERREGWWLGERGGRGDGWEREEGGVVVGRDREGGTVVWRGKKRQRKQAFYSFTNLPVNFCFSFYFPYLVSSSYVCCSPICLT
jgi:hypothetical protein